ncbi:MAG: DMT family transporter [Pseudomonadota bacterium]
MSRQHRLAIALLLFAMVAMTTNDVVIKLLSDSYPLHQMVFVRSAVGLSVGLVFLYFEGGLSLLRTEQTGLHVLRATAIVLANMIFFAAIAVLPLGLATGIFFVSPLFITLLSVPLLGARVGPRRLVAVGLGLLGVAIIVSGDVALPVGTAPWVLILPIAAAFLYALTNVLSSKLGQRSRASAMSLYIQTAFLSVALVFYFAAGDGRFAVGQTNGSITFLLRAWTWPAPQDVWLFGVMGVLGGVIGYVFSQAYRLGQPATLAPFEYVALPLAMMWGALVFNEDLGLRLWIGSALIVGSGLYVFWRERQ